MTKTAAHDCSHSKVTLTPSTHATDVGYIRPSPGSRLAATSISGRASNGSQSQNESGFAHESSFPGPLVLPDDDLSIDPKQPPQSVRAWSRLKDRNAVTSARKTIYVAAPPSTERCAVAKDWSVARQGNQPLTKGTVDVEAILKYLTAFYYGIDVKMLPSTLDLVPWESGEIGSTAEEKGQRGKRTRAVPKIEYVGLEIPAIDEIIGIRHRREPRGVFRRQLNLNDLLDAAMAMLPADAYALLMLVKQDLYEDEEDDFCCGRAYGGSRVAVVSSARYDPAVDESMGANLSHMWPFSHCASYVSNLARPGESTFTGTSSTFDTVDIAATPMGRAIIAAEENTASSACDESMFLPRVCRTASHELGHCLGLEHCTYYACVMQGTAGMGEDYRQPFYLCPVCVQKVGRACRESIQAESVAKSAQSSRRIAKDTTESERTWLMQWEIDWCRQMQEFCRNRPGSSWTGLAAWCEARAKQLQKS